MRVAILIDGDNISASHSDRIVAIGRGEGRVDVHRAYGNAANGSGWNAVPGIRFVHAGTGKNAADLLLSIDAVELALREGYETFVIASSDGDFSHLAIRLRETGHLVVGCGVATAPARFRTACSRFVELGSAEVHLPVPPAASELDHKLCKMIRSHGHNGAGMPLAVLGQLMNTQHRIPSASLAESNWRAYLGNRPELYDLDPRGPHAHVRLKPATRAI